jgi:hypothetical protein
MHGRLFPAILANKAVAQTSIFSDAHFLQEYMMRVIRLLP